MRRVADKSLRVAGVVLALLAIAFIGWFTSGCESGSGGRSLEVEPRNATIGPNISSFKLGVVSGVRDLSLPLEWSAANAQLGSIAGSSGYTAVYTSTGRSGVNTITVRDQYGVEGVASVEQVDYETDAPAEPGETVVEEDDGDGGDGGDDGDQGDGGDLSVSVSGSTVTVRNLWDDGSDYTHTIPDNAAEDILTDIEDSNHPGESHDLSFTDITWAAGDLASFTLVVDGSTTLTYP